MTRIAAVLAAALTLTACSGMSPGTTKDAQGAESATLVIPDFPTASEQYGYALAYQRAQLLSSDPARRRGQLDKMAQAYQRVVQSFPDDQTYTPTAMLDIADTYAVAGDNDRAVAAYQDIASRYSGIPRVHGRAMFTLAKLRDSQGKHQEAKEIYRGLMTQYENSNDAAGRSIAVQAKNQYLTAQEEKQGKSRS